MIRLVLILTVTVAALLLLAGEVLVPPAVERVVEERVADRLDVQSVDAHLKGFPVVPRVLATGEVPRLDIDLRGVEQGPLTFDSAQVRLFGIEVERGALFGGKARLRHIDRGEVEADVTEEDLQAAIPGDLADLQLSPGRATVEVAGVSAEVGVSVADGVLRIDLPVVPDLTFTLPADVFPCPLDGEVLEGRVHLTCTLDEVPEWVVAEANRP